MGMLNDEDSRGGAHPARMRIADPTALLDHSLCLKQAVPSKEDFGTIGSHGWESAGGQLSSARIVLMSFIASYRLNVRSHTRVKFRRRCCGAQHDDTS